MKTRVGDLLGIEFPLFAFSHCRDVVAAVTNAGGFGVLGAMGFGPDELEVELAWIDEHVNGKPYGVDLIVPEKFVGKGENVDVGSLAAQIPARHREFVAGLLAEHGLSVPAGNGGGDEVPMFSDENVERMLDVSFAHPIRLIANALGVPPAFMVERAKSEGVPIAALVGAKEHAVKQVENGVDLLVAQGYEAGGHTGDVATWVLVPEVIEAIRPIGDVPVLAAGGIVTGRQMAAALAIGAEGVWTGSVWLTTEEAETSQFMKEKMLAASSRDTLRSRARTGKQCRQLRTAWHDAWDHPDNPDPLPMPLQTMLVEDALRAVETAAEGGHEGAKELATYFVGQGVGLMTSIRPAADVVYEFMEDFAGAVERMEGIVAGETGSRP